VKKKAKGALLKLLAKRSEMQLQEQQQQQAAESLRNLPRAKRVAAETTNLMTSLRTAADASGPIEWEGNFASKQIGPVATLSHVTPAQSKETNYHYITCVGPRDPLNLCYRGPS
jgi:hypothetical protein